MADKPFTAADILAGKAGKIQYAEPEKDTRWSTKGRDWGTALAGPWANTSWAEKLGGVGETLGGLLGSMTLHDAPENLTEAYRRAKAGQPLQAAGSVLAALPMTPGAGGVGKKVVEDVVDQEARRAAEEVAQPERDVAAMPMAENAQEAAAFNNMINVPEIRGLPVDQAITQARSEPHLIPSGNRSRSFYVGAPADIQSYDDLLRRRAEFDRYLEGGSAPGEGPYANQSVPLDINPGMGADWYGRYRTGMDRMTGGDPNMNNWMSNMQGSFSQGVDPRSELGFVVKEAVSRAAGQPTRAMYQTQHDALTRAIESGDPEAMQFGNKTEQYADYVNPTSRALRTATGVNDFRYANQWGFLPTELEARAGSVNLNPAQHKWLDHETALAVDRANQRALYGRTDWTGPEIQAIPWVRQKAEALAGAPGSPLRLRGNLPAAWEEANKTAPDFASRFQANATYEQQPGQALANRPGGVDPHMPNAQYMTKDQKRDYALDQGASWASAPSTNLQPSEYGRDVIYGAGRVGDTGVGVYTLPTNPGVGVYQNQAGKWEFNPNFTASPLMPFETSSSLPAAIAETAKANPLEGGGRFRLSVGGKDIPIGRTKLPSNEDIRTKLKALGPDYPDDATVSLIGNNQGPPIETWDLDKNLSTIGGMPPSNKRILPVAADLMNVGEHTRSLFGGQEMGAWSKAWEDPSVAGTQGYFVPMNRAATVDEVKNLAAKTGGVFPDVVDTGRGMLVTRFPFRGPLDKPFNASTARQMEMAIGGAKPADAGVHVPVNVSSGSVEPKWGAPGSGQATSAWLEDVNQNPAMRGFFNNPEIGRVAAGLNARDIDWGGKTVWAPERTVNQGGESVWQPAGETQIGGPARDIHNLRNVAAAENIPGAGPIDKIEWARKNGIPATAVVGGATVALYPEAGFPAGLGQDEFQAPPQKAPFALQPPAAQNRPEPIGSSPAFDQWWQGLYAGGL